MLTTSVLLGLGIALARRGDLRLLATHTFRFWWLFVLAFLLKFLISRSAGMDLPWLTELSGPLQTAIYAVVLAVLALNWVLPWIWMVMTGVAANLTVVAANGGQMPVWEQALVMLGKTASLERLRSGGEVLHVSATDNTKLLFLGDWVPFPGPISAVVSPGDVVMALGIILFINTVTQPSYQPADEALSPATDNPPATPGDQR